MADLDRALQDDAVRDQTLNLLAARPFHPSQLAATRIAGAFPARTQRGRSVLHWLYDHGERICSVCASFERLPDDLFGAGDLSRARTRDALARAGAFRAVLALAPDNSVAAIGAALWTRANLAGIANRREVVPVWIDQLIAAGLIPRGTPAIQPEPDADPLGDYDRFRYQGEPADVVARKRRGGVLEARGEYQAACGEYDEVLRSTPADLVARCRRAEVLALMGRFEDALAGFDGVLAVDASHPTASKGRAETLCALGRLDESLSVFDTLCARGRCGPEVGRGRAKVLVALGRLPDALAGLPESLSGGYPNWDSYHLRGTILLEAGMVDAARAVFAVGAEHPTEHTRQRFRSSLARLH